MRMAVVVMMTTRHARELACHLKMVTCCLDCFDSTRERLNYMQGQKDENKARLEMKRVQTTSTQQRKESCCTGQGEKAEH